MTEILGEKEIENLQFYSDTEELKQEMGISEIQKEMTIDDLSKVLGSTIKKDQINSTITILSMLTAYTKDSQFNVSYRAPSSTGKSYIPLELSTYFPKEDVFKYAGASPTSFFHEVGQWDGERKVIMIDLRRKILIFLDMPHDQLLQKLRPLLSHDDERLVYKITDRLQKYGLKTKTVEIIGFSSVIFCTGSLKIDEQEATRNFILSPETTQEKIREGIYLKALRKGNPKAFQNYLEKFPERKILQERIRLIKKANVNYVIIQNPHKIVERFLKKYPKLKSRYQRDIERIISLIQGLALFNMWHRKKDEEGNIFSNENDENTAFELFDSIAESQELGIPPFVYNFFKEIILPLWEKFSGGIARKEIISKNFEVYGRPLQDWFLRQQLLPAMESAGLITEEQDPEDKKRKLVFVTLQSDSLYQKTLPRDPPHNSKSDNLEDFLEESDESYQEFKEKADSEE